MKIARIVVWAADLPLAEPYRLSGGRLRFERLDSTLVRVETACGRSGWGEGCPWGASYLPAHGPGLRAALATLAPVLIGRDPRSLDAIVRAMDLALPGHPYAKSPLDIACWDLLGQDAGLPLWQLLGGEAAERVPLNSSIPTGSPEEMAERIRSARSRGYRTHSAKIGGADPALDVARIEAVRSSLTGEDRVTFDVNRAWTPGIAVQALNAAVVREWVEQPCESMRECAQVARKVSCPILLDECLHDFADHLEAWRTGAFEGVKVKPNRLGGLTRARQVRDFGVSVGWQMHIEDVGGTALADTAAIHLASSTPAEFRLASWLGHEHLAVDPVPGQGSRNADGYARPPTAPGLGVAPDPKLLGEPVAVYE